MSFDPCADFAERWPAWTLTLARLTGVSEEFDYHQKVVTLDPRLGDLEWAVAHATAHLDLSHSGAAQFFSEEEEAEADSLARGRVDDLVPVDGDPSVPL